MGSPTFINNNDLYKKHEGRVGLTLSNKNQVKSFSFSLSVTFHPTISMSLLYKSSDSPSVVSKSSSVTCATSEEVVHVTEEDV
jgi:hypothetical protein